MHVPGKTSQLQIRVSPRQKAALQKLADAAGLDMSAYVLQRALPPARGELRSCLARCTEGEDLRFALADLNRLLSSWSRGELLDAIEPAPDAPATPYAANYAAALIEQACARHHVPIPAWVRQIPPLEQPAFASSLLALRTHLLASSPAAFRRRNLFVDSGLGAQV